MSTPVNEPDQPADSSGGVLVGGRYRLLERIGSGGMGVVWSANDEVLRRKVAVKELHHSWGSSDQTVATGRERSLREARAAAALRHPNIVGVYDMVDHDRRPWIVMELVAGRSLKDVVTEDGPMSVERAVGIGLQLLSALQTAHAAGITHRDVKPANVLICDDDVVRLTDFGLASMQDAEALTETGAVLGTPGYLAPEQAKGLTPGPPADVFGLAAVLYYAIEGVGPFHRDGYLPMLAAYARHDIRAPQHAGALAPALMRLLAADPAKRPTAEQAHDMLLGGAVQQSGSSRRRVLTGAALAVVTAAAGTGLWAGIRHTSTDRSKRRAVPAPAPAPTPRPVGLGPAAWHRDDLQTPVVVGSRVVGGYPDGVLAADLESGTQLWRRRIPGGPTVTEFDQGLVLVEDDVRYQVLNAATGVVRARQPEGPAGITAGIAGLFLATDLPDTLTAYDAVTGRRSWRLRVDGEFGWQYFRGPGDLLCGGLSGAEDDPSWVYGIHLRTGAVAWKTRVAAASLMLGPWGDSEAAYAVTLEHGHWILTTVDAVTGKRAWSVPMTKDTSTFLFSPIKCTGVASVGELVVASLSDTRMTLKQSGLIAVNAGTIRWRRPLLNPILAVSGERLFAASYDSVLHELDPATGRTLWSIPTSAPVDTLGVGSTMLVATAGQSTTAYPLRKP